jgi:translation initiation factor 4G
MTDDPEEEQKQKAFKGILNKLTPDNFEKLSERVRGSSMCGWAIFA